MKLTDMPDVVIAANNVLKEIDTFFTSTPGSTFPLLSAKQFASSFYSNGHIDQAIVDALPFSQRVAFINSINHIIQITHYQGIPNKNKDTTAIYNAIEFIKDSCILLEEINTTPVTPAKIFYSWQSSTPGKFNRYFIRDCLNHAVSEVNSDIPVEELERYGEVTVDSDTAGTSGSPHIFGTILGKIDDASIFIADISLVAHKTCNSNVLLELGYAIKTLGFPKIIMLFNTALGEIDDLPFDLRSQRLTTYSYKDGDDKKQVSKQFTSTLKTAITSLL